jgi:hypothetical protein
MTVRAQLFYGHGACPLSPPLAGEGRGEGGVPQGQSRRCERTFRLTRTRGFTQTFGKASTRGAPPSSQPSPPKEGVGARCGQWIVCSPRHASQGSQRNSTEVVS